MRKIRKLLIFRNKLKFESDLIFRNESDSFLFGSLELGKILSKKGVMLVALDQIEDWFV